MASTSHSNYCMQRSRADHLINHAGRLKLKTQQSEKEIFLHAALAAHVACWDSYIKKITKEKYAAINSPTLIGYASLHEIARKRMETAAEKLNTPNAENTRNFLMECSDFDPWPLWVNVKFGKNKIPSILHVKEQLNQILKVRHSFAHGFTMPAFHWNQDSNGRASLSCTTLRGVSVFFQDLVTKTDLGFAHHIHHKFGIPKPW